jgi:hypothetical protein
MVLLVFVCIGIIFVGISIKAVNKGVGNHIQASASSVVTIDEVYIQPIVINAICGPAHQQEWEREPDSGFCKEGLVVNRKLVGDRLSWGCRGFGGGTDAHCYSDRSNHSTSSCGRAVTGRYRAEGEIPLKDMCVGEISSMPIPTKKTEGGNDRWQWECKGSSEKCLALKIVDGACNDFDDCLSVEKSESFLCKEGVPYGIQGDCSSGLSWKCSGVNGGAAADCHK